MSEMRRDPLSGRWVVISKDRAARPIEFTVPPVRRVAGRCPFCFGNEADTPHAIVEYPPANAAHRERWLVRVVPNRYPAVRADLDWPGDESVEQTSGDHSWPLEARRPGFGVHEVIVESPDHAISLTDLSDQQVQLTLTAYRDRILALRGNSQLRYAQVFKNVGLASGASIEHAHSQLIALPYIPIDVQMELELSQQWWRQRQTCLLCDMRMREQQQAVRTVVESANFFAFCPFASRFPFECWLLPKQHASHFETATDNHLAELAVVLKDVIRRIERAAPGSAYNFLLHTSPLGSEPLSHYHWHLEIFPRLTTAAGFEFGTSCFINPVPPEDAAANLRS